MTRTTKAGSRAIVRSGALTRGATASPTEVRNAIDHFDDAWQTTRPRTGKPVIVDRGGSRALLSEDEMLRQRQDYCRKGILVACSHVHRLQRDNWQPTSLSGVNQQPDVDRFLARATTLYAKLQPSQATDLAALNTSWRALVADAEKITDPEFVTAGGAILGNTMDFVEATESAKTTLTSDETITRLSDKIFRFSGRSYFTALVALQDDTLAPLAVDYLRTNNVFYALAQNQTPAAAAIFANERTRPGDALWTADTIAQLEERGRKLHVDMLGKNADHRRSVWYTEIKEACNVPPARLDKLYFVRQSLERSENALIRDPDVGYWWTGLEGLSAAWQGGAPKLLPCNDPTGKVLPEDLLARTARWNATQQLDAEHRQRYLKLSDSIATFSEEACCEGILPHQLLYLYRAQGRLRELVDEVEALECDVAVRALETLSVHDKPQKPTTQPGKKSKRSRAPKASPAAVVGDVSQSVAGSASQPDVGEVSQSGVGDGDAAIRSFEIAASVFGPDHAEANPGSWTLVSPPLLVQPQRFVAQPYLFTETSNNAAFAPVRFLTRLALACEVRAMVHNVMDPGRCLRDTTDHRYAAARSLVQHLNKHTDGTIPAENYLWRALQVLADKKPASTAQRSDRPHELARVLHPGAKGRFYGCWGLDGRVLSFCDRSTCPLEVKWLEDHAGAAHPWAHEPVDLGADALVVQAWTPA